MLPSRALALSTQRSSARGALLGKQSVHCGDHQSERVGSPSSEEAPTSYYAALSTRRPARQMPTMLPLPLLPPPYEPPPMPPPPPLAARTPELSGPCYKPPPRPPPRHLHCQPRRVPLRHMCGGEGGHLAGHGDREARAGLETSSRESNTPIQQPTAPRAQGQSTTPRSIFYQQQPRCQCPCL